MSRTVSKPSQAGFSRQVTLVGRAKSPVTSAGSRGETRVHTLTFAFSLRTTVLKAPLLRAWLWLWTSHLSFPSSLDMDVRSTNHRIRTRNLRSAIAFGVSTASPSWERLCDALSSAAGAITLYSSRCYSVG